MVTEKQAKAILRDLLKIFPLVSCTEGKCLMCIAAAAMKRDGVIAAISVNEVGDEVGLRADRVAAALTALRCATAARGNRPARKALISLVGFESDGSVLYRMLFLRHGVK